MFTLSHMRRALYSPRIIEQFLPKNDNVLNDKMPSSPIVEQLRHGFLYDEFEVLRHWLDVSEEQLANWLDISRATLHRRKKTGHFDKNESDRIARLARVFGKAFELFGSEEAAREWLKSPAHAMRGETPIAFCDTEVGARMVEDLIGQIDHGVFA
jgi:putative toxin-antitoxin system antitoxin component (TIGR02293 family)